MGIVRFAAIDVGSFSLEMSIYEIGSKIGIRCIDNIKHTIGLGKDTYNTGLIGYELVEEMCDVLTDFASIMKEYKVAGYRAYATSAMREASNRVIILDQIKNRTGIDVEIISNSEQRLINYKAIAYQKEKFEQAVLEGTAIVDVGFGSVQITLYDKGNMLSTQNIELGVLRTQEMLSRLDKPLAKKIDILEELIDNELATYKKIYLKDRQIKHIIGIGEPMQYIFGSGSVPNNMNIDEYKERLSRLYGRNIADIKEELELDEEKSKVVLPCMVIFSRILELMNSDNIWFPGVVLTDGIAAEYADDQKIIKLGHDFNKDIVAAAKSMSKRYRGNSTHMQNVVEYSLDIFDAMKKYHGMGKRERLLLQISAILHNCGKFINMRSPADSTYNIISSTEIIGLSHAERMMVATIARNNLDKFSYEESTMTIAKLTAILRLANSLDRSHKQKIDNYRFKMADDRLVITATTGEDMSLEFISFDMHKKFFEEIFGIEPVLTQTTRPRE